jgi:Ca-activated chloride channel family protein
MTRPLVPLLEENETTAQPQGDDAGFGSLSTSRGHLPLEALSVRGRIDGLLAQVELAQTFRNAFDEPLEATYIFPLPDRTAVSAFRMEVGDRVIEGVLEERGKASEQYDEAIARGHRASIAEEERAGVFTLRVGNLMPGERATVRLTLSGVLPYADGEVTFRFPLVVAPRYIPGRSLPGPSAGDGTAPDTDAVPDASRITPPVLLPGFPNPVQLAIAIDLHGAVENVRSNLHAVRTEESDGRLHIEVHPGERLNRDFILRFRLAGETVRTALSMHPEGSGVEGTFALTLIPPAKVDGQRPARDVVFVLDRSGSMGGWKMVAARRAVARMVDTLRERDRFSILAFDHVVETPPQLPAGLVPATDRNRFRAVEYLASVGARGGTEMAQPLDRAVTELNASERDATRVLVLITDGQVGQEAQILRTLGERLTAIQVFTLGIDRAVNETFLRRLAELGGGTCDLVESEDRLDEVMDSLHRRLGTPVLTGLDLQPSGWAIEPDSVVPDRMPDLFSGSPVLLLGRYRGDASGKLVVRGVDCSGQSWSEGIVSSVRENPAIASVWARGQVRNLEDRYTMSRDNLLELEQQIIATSLRYHVLCRFTAYVAIDRSSVVNAGGQGHRIVQPVEVPEGSGAPTLHMAYCLSPPASACVAPPRGRALLASALNLVRLRGELRNCGLPESEVLLDEDIALVKGHPTPHEAALTVLERAEKYVQGSSEAENVLALGRTLFVLLTGRPPADDSASVLAHVPAELRAICLKAIDPDPAQRYASVAELAEALRRFLAVPPAPKRRKGFWK